MNELLPCPFCGCHAMITSDGYCWDVTCSKIRCRGFYATLSKETREAAIAAWNSRATDPRIPALIEAIAQLKDGIDERDYVPGRNVTPIWNNDLDAVFAAADAMEVE